MADEGDQVLRPGRRRDEQGATDPGVPVTLFHVNGVEVVDTFAEAFGMSACALVVTAETIEWARTEGQVATGYAASVIGCDAEAGIDCETTGPDGRPGVRL